MLAIINSQPQYRASMSRSTEMQAFLDRQADGVIYATVYHDEVVPPDEMLAVPAVLIGARDRRGEIPSVMPDERAGAASVVDLLVRKGHRRIAFAASSVDVPATRGPLQGYRDGMIAAGLDPDAFVVEATSEASGGYEATMGLLDDGRRPRHSAHRRVLLQRPHGDGRLPGGCRTRAVGAARLSVVGFDDQDPIAASLFPPLTTVALPHYEMGAWAVETLTAIIEGREEVRLLGAHPTLLACPIVERESVAPPRDDSGARLKPFGSSGAARRGL